MVHIVIYPHEKNFMGRLAILTIREHLCDFYQEWTRCVGAGSQVDTQSGHRVCSGCDRITVSSGLRTCDICEREYIDKNKYQDPKYDTNCPACVEEYGIENE